MTMHIPLILTLVAQFQATSMFMTILAQVIFLETLLPSTTMVLANILVLKFKEIDFLVMTTKPEVISMGQ